MSCKTWKIKKFGIFSRQNKTCQIKRRMWTPKKTLVNSPKSNSDVFEIEKKLSNECGSQWPKVFQNYHTGRRWAKGVEVEPRPRPAEVILTKNPRHCPRPKMWNQDPGRRWWAPIRHLKSTIFVDFSFSSISFHMLQKIYKFSKTWKLWIFQGKLQK